MGRLRPLAKLVRSAVLRRLAIGFALFNAAEYGEWLAVLVYAYGHGGARAAGLLAFAMFVPCMLLSPILATFADRYPPGRVLLAGYLAQAVGLAVLALVLAAGAPAVVVYVVAFAGGPTFNITRPTVNVVLPLAVATPEELTAANASLGWIESVGVVAGPLLTSLLFALGGPALVFGVLAALMFAACWMTVPISRALPRTRQSLPGSPLADAWEGVRVLAAEPATAGLVGMATSESIFSGALDVLNVILAITVLGIGNSGAGLLTAAFGVGGVAAVYVTLGLVGRRRLAPALILGGFLMGGSIAAILAVPRVGVVLLLLAAASVGQSLFDVSGRTLLQRTGSPAVLGRIFGLLEGMQMAAGALGSLLISVFASLGGADGAILGMALIMPVMVVLFLPVILRADAHATVPIVGIGLLRRTALFQPLPPPEVEGVARALQPVAAEAGEVIVREGEPGDSYYLIAEGEVEVSTRAGLRRTLGPGDGFGEIALLHDTPRIATVTARANTTLYSLDHDDFIRAVTGVEAIHSHALTLAETRKAETEAVEE